jgi:hypothetical protein
MASSERDRVKRLLTSGAGIAGPALSGALGYYAAGPVGGAAAAVAGEVLVRGVDQWAQRLLSESESARVGAAAAIAVNLIRVRISEGQIPRQDIFYRQGFRRPDAEELLEGVLLKARDEYEERKIRHLGVLFGNLVFDPAVSVPLAHRLIASMSGLSYRQVTFLALLKERGVVDVSGLRSNTHYKDHELEALKIDEMNLHEGGMGMHGLVWNWKGFDDRLSNIGRILVRLAEIDSVEAEDLAAISGLLARCPPMAKPRFGSDPIPEGLDG